MRTTKSSVEGLPGIADEHKLKLLAAIDALAKAKTVASDDRQIALHGAFVDPAGIASRPWFQNLFVAPGRELGYGAVVLPALTEALLDKNQTQIAREVERLVLAIGRAKKALSE